MKFYEISIGGIKHTFQLPEGKKMPKGATQVHRKQKSEPDNKQVEDTKDKDKS
jgi:hypothetical protein